jgi:hypothetical protein
LEKTGDGIVTTKLGEAFDVENEEGGGTFDILPSGKYNADLMSVEVVRLKSGKGQAVKMNWCVYDGDYEGRWLFDQVIIQHESKNAQKFGRRKFKDICVACGITSSISDVGVLEGKQCTLDVGIEKNKTGEFPDKNRIRRVLSFSVPPSGNSKSAALDEEAPW